MKPHECKNERLVIEAARTGRWDTELQQHAAQCQACADAVLAARVLNEMRAIDESEARIPNAGLMWWKAQLLAKREAGERATQPITFVERFAYVWIAVCAIGVSIWQWRTIRTWLASLAPKPFTFSFAPFWTAVSHACASVFPSWPGKSAHLQGAGLAALVGVGILLIFIAFAAYFAASEK
jgi:hypothetical protein